eukprot:3830000-Prorocentrum_lima.AAC.1
MRQHARRVTLQEQQARQAEIVRTNATFEYIFGDPEHLGGRLPEIDAMEQYWNYILEQPDYAAMSFNPPIEEDLPVTQR